MAHLARWLQQHDRELGFALDVERARALGAAWFGRYLDADWRPRDREQSQAILTSLGLDDPFWQLGEAM